MCVEEAGCVDRVSGLVRPCEVAEDSQDEEEGHVCDGFGGCCGAVAVHNSCTNISSASTLNW